MKKYTKYILGALVIAVIAITLTSNKKTAVVEDTSLIQKVLEKGEIEATYVVYSPLITLDKNTGELAGLSYEIAELAAEKIGIEINWKAESTWAALTEDIKTNRFDMSGVQLWINAARARNVTFSDPVFFSPVYVYVRAGDTRFDDNLDILNSPEYRIGVLDGTMSTFIAKEDFPLTNTMSLPESSSISEVLLNLKAGKVDIAFAEPSAAKAFLESHPESIRKVPGETIRQFGNAYPFPHEEQEFVDLWNSALEELHNEGKIESVLEQYGVRDDYLIEKKSFN